jgi:hypothetical protein
MATSQHVGIPIQPTFRLGRNAIGPLLSSPSDTLTQRVVPRFNPNVALLISDDSAVT